MTYRVRYREDSRGDLFEIETTSIWEVVDDAGIVVRTYTSESFGTLGGGTWQMDDTHSGAIAKVEISEDRRSVKVSRGNALTLEPLP